MCNDTDSPQCRRDRPRAAACRDIQEYDPAVRKLVPAAVCMLDYPVVQNGAGGSDSLERLAAARSAAEKGHAVSARAARNFRSADNSRACRGTAVYRDTGAQRGIAAAPDSPDNSDGSGAADSSAVRDSRLAKLFGTAGSSAFLSAVHYSRPVIADTRCCLLDRSSAHSFDWIKRSGMLGFAADQCR